MNSELQYSQLTCSLCRRWLCFRTNWMLQHIGTQCQLWTWSWNQYWKSWKREHQSMCHKCHRPWRYTPQHLDRCENKNMAGILNIDTLTHKLSVLSVLLFFFLESLIQFFINFFQLSWDFGMKCWKISQSYYKLISKQELSKLKAIVLFVLNHREAQAQFKTWCSQTFKSLMWKLQSQLTNTIVMVARSAVTRHQLWQCQAYTTQM